MVLHFDASLLLAESNHVVQHKTKILFLKNKKKEHEKP